METRTAKTGTNQQTYTGTRVTNPLHRDVNNTSAGKSTINTRQLLDKIAFTLLTAGAIWAFYTALTSLML